MNQRLEIGHWKSTGVDKILKRKMVTSTDTLVAFLKNCAKSICEQTITKKCTRRSTKSTAYRANPGFFFGSRTALEDYTSRFLWTRVKRASLLFLAILNSCHVLWIQRWPRLESSRRRLYTRAQRRCYDCLLPSSSAYCPGDSDTKRHEERGPGVNKQKNAIACHSCLHWCTRWNLQEFHPRKDMSLVIADHWALTWLGQAIAFRHPLLNTRGVVTLAQKASWCTRCTIVQGTQWRNSNTSHSSENKAFVK